MLSDEVIAELNEKLNLIAETIGTQQRVRITYFVPDKKKLEEHTLPAPVA